MLSLKYTLKIAMMFNVIISNLSKTPNLLLRETQNNKEQLVDDSLFAVKHISIRGTSSQPSLINKNHSNLCHISDNGYIKDGKKSNEIL